MLFFAAEQAQRNVDPAAYTSLPHLLSTRAFLAKVRAHPSAPLRHPFFASLFEHPGPHAPTHSFEYNYLTIIIDYLYLICYHQP